MPTLGDMMEVVDLLKVKAIAVEEDKCVVVRNRNSKCKKCMEACISDAITAKNNELTIDSAACVNCGCCVAVCPTNALHAVDPTTQKVLADAQRTTKVAGGCTVIACARKASKNEGDPEKFAEVPCLGHINEWELLRLSAEGFDDISLVDGDCATCKYGAASSHIDATVETAITLAEAAGLQGIIARTQEFPLEARLSSSKNLRGRNRRGLIAQTGNYMKTVAGNVAEKTIEERFGDGAQPVTLHDRLRAGKNGKLPTFEPNVNYSMLESMEGIASKSGTDLPCSDEVINTRKFGSVTIDSKPCSGCGMCIMFCPTGALQYAQYDEPENSENRYIEFQAADCTQCMLCRDVCLRSCLNVDGRLEVRELFDFEPRLLEISKPPSSSALLDLSRRNKK